MQAKRHVGVLGGVVAGGVQIGLIETPLIAPAADQALDGDVAMTEQRLAERIEAMPHARGIHQMAADQRVIDQSRHLHAMTLQHDQVELGVVCRLGHRRILENRLHKRLHRVPVEMALGLRAAQRDVGAGVFREGKRKAHQPRARGLHRIGLGVEGKRGACLHRLARLLHEALDGACVGKHGVGAVAHHTLGRQRHFGCSLVRGIEK